jgi:transcriptional antiterminator RfaH
MPLRRKMLRHARKLTAVEAPLFPRYLFISFDPRRDQWRKVNGTFGVSHLVT